ncbi:hypothetical protein LCGC14_1885570 [marine sediment metagenome]|uniref:Uncharacterized protein n=1 Tax=marine sediment metagenome TaxID=412755 RepID=A0A0F9IEY5_9ZZZZ
MSLERFASLLQAASEAYDDGRDPFSNEWLVEHNVTSDECIQLSGLIASAIDLFLLNFHRAGIKVESPNK